MADVDGRLANNPQDIWTTLPVGDSIKTGDHIRIGKDGRWHRAEAGEMGQLFYVSTANAEPGDRLTITVHRASRI